MLDSENSEKGISRLSVIPMRSDPSESSEMVSQLLFGEHYSVVAYSSNKQWLKIKNHFDDYEGWISRGQHHAISHEYFDQINHSEYKICLDICSKILYRKNHVDILIGSILPITTSELFKMEEKLAFNGEAKSLGDRRNFEFVKLTALRYLNAPYLWGGKMPFGIDCSGFTQMVFKISGYSLKRDSSQQKIQGAEVGNDISNALPGDLAFFTGVDTGVSHVGIILEDQHIIHASGKVKIDQLHAEGIYNEDLMKITHKLTTIKRVLK